MAAAIGLGRRAADYDISVLITGASGTGKELLARAIHHASSRSERAFVVENCGALPDELLESELFGCKKGAFTGAYQDRIGLFEVADGGSIFLDEIGETSPAFQVKLLRVLQEGEIRPLGAQRPRRVDVRVISATNRDLAADVEAGRFRRDLYYRLAAFPIHLPPLRERPMDIPAIAARILQDVNRAFHRAVPSLAEETLRRMADYAWPGNVRELHNEIQRMVALSDGDVPLPPALLSPAIAGGGRTAAAGAGLRLPQGPRGSAGARRHRRGPGAAWRQYQPCGGGAWPVAGGAAQQDCALRYPAGAARGIGAGDPCVPLPRPLPQGEGEKSAPPPLGGGGGRGSGRTAAPPNPQAAPAPTPARPPAGRGRRHPLRPGSPPCRPARAS